ncbi:type I secretion protein TolC [Pseudomonas sp. BRG-100]|nr:type I secretion protein TolC [Pseudomonas sp. BRG-100]
MRFIYNGTFAGLFLLQLSPVFAAVELPWLDGSSIEGPAGIGAKQLAEEMASGDQRYIGNDKILSAIKCPDLFGLVLKAVNHHPTVLTAAQTIAQQEGQIGVAEAGYYPQVSAGINSGHLSSFGHSNVATLSVSQMLYDFGKVGGKVTQAKGGLQKQRALFLKQVDLISQQTAEAFIAVHRYQILRQIAAEQVEAVKSVLETAKLRANSGLSSQSDPVQARTRVESAQASLYQTESLLAQWRDRLQLLTGASLPEKVADVPSSLEDLVSFNTPINYGLLPDVLIAESDRQVALGSLENAKAQRYPTFALEGSLNQALSGANPSNGERRGSYNTLSLSSSVLLYQGGGISAQIHSANSAILAAESTVNQARLAAENQMLNAREQVLGARKRLSILRLRMATMQETLALYKEQYSVGTRSVLDLLNAEQEVHQAAADQESARHDLWSGLVSYIAAAGKNRDAYKLNGSSIHGIEILQ